MRLTRRQVLAAGVFGVAGCVERAPPVPGTRTESSPSPGGTDTDSSGSPTSAATETRTGPPESVGDRTDSTGDSTTNRSQAHDGSRSLAVSEVRRREGDGSLSAAATVLESTVRGDRPPRLRVTLTPDAETTVTYRDCPPQNFLQAVSTTGENRLLLTRYDGSSESGDCWHLPRETLNMGRPCYEETVTVAAGDSFARTFTVWDDRGNATCYPPERYRVDVRVAAGDAVDSTHRWSVVLEITT